MNVQASKDLRQVAALYATGEIGTYTRQLAAAESTARGIARVREVANGHWCELAELMENPADTGIQDFVYEIAAGAFLEIANHGVDDVYKIPATLEPPTAAALWITGTRAAYDELVPVARKLYTEFYEIGRRLLISAAAYEFASPPVATAYQELAARVAAEIGQYTIISTDWLTVYNELHQG